MTAHTHISELDLAKLSEGVDDVAADFFSQVKLDHAHVRRAEHGILVVDHNEDDWALSQDCLQVVVGIVAKHVVMAEVRSTMLFEAAFKLGVVMANQSG